MNDFCFKNTKHNKLQILEENPAYLSEQLITYIGNKRALLPFINSAIEIVKKRLKKAKLAFFDAYTGSGIVARFFKKYASFIVVNDLEKYCEVIGKCYLTNKSEVNFDLLKSIYEKLKHELDTRPLKSGFITELYSPKDEENIKPGERVFYTRRNAMYLDTARQLIATVDEKYQHFFLAPLLSEASIHSNTAGVFKGFYKNSKTGIGKFGGTNGDALKRIKGNIELKLPIFSNFECDWEVYREDTNKLIYSLPEVDIAYLDPPYNEHPYGSNYFMLNLLVDYIKPEKISRVSGIPTNWNRSAYNKKPMAKKALFDVVSNVKAKFVLISFNSEGFISRDEFVDFLNKIGRLEIYETKYNTFRGCRNLNNRNIHVKEHLYLLEKK